MNRATAAVSVVFGLAGLALGQVVGQDGRVRFDGTSVVRVSPSSPEQLRAVLDASDGLWGEREGVGPIEVLADAESLAALREMGLEPETLIADVQVLIDAERAQITALSRQRDLSFFENFHPYAEIVAFFNQIAADHPGLATVSVIGQSLEGRDIIALEITGPGDASGRPVINLNGCQHAREWITPATMSFVADRLTEGYGNDPRITQILDHAVFQIVPIVNPDGYVYSWDVNRLWRKNRRDNGDGTTGVDLNRNWGYQWGLDGASDRGQDETYRGPAPFSEPETQVLRDYLQSDPRIIGQVDVHSFSQLILYPWGYTADPPPEPDFSFFVDFSDELSETIESAYGQFYTPQPGIDLYITSGTLGDWTYSEGMYGWTFELRPVSGGGAGGFILPPEQIVPTVTEVLPAFLAMAEELALPIRFRELDAPPTVLEADAPNSFLVGIEDGTDELLAGSAVLRWSLEISQDVRTEVLADLGGDAFGVTIPAIPCGRTIEYFIEAQSMGGQTLRFPATGTIEATAMETQTVFFDDFASDQGWTVGAPDDDATSGIWERGDPQATAAQPEDASIGTNAYITDPLAGNGLGARDIDNGKTTLTSPSFDGVAPANWHRAATVVTFDRWLSNDKGNVPNEDPLVVDVSGDDGASWTPALVINDNFEAWRGESVKLADFVTPGPASRVRFIASDENGGSIVEAGVDAFEVVTLGCRYAPADLDRDGDRDGDDFFLFLDFFSNGQAGADLDLDGDRDGDDFFGFLQLFTAP